MAPQTYGGEGSLPMIAGFQEELQQKRLVLLVRGLFWLLGIQAPKEAGG